MVGHKTTFKYYLKIRIVIDTAKVSSELKKKKNTHVEHIWRESQACHIKIKITQGRPTFLCQYVAYYRAVLDIFFFFCHTILLHCSRIRIDLFPVITFSQAGHTHTHIHTKHFDVIKRRQFDFYYTYVYAYTRKREKMSTLD